MELFKEMFSFSFVLNVATLSRDSKLLVWIKYVFDGGSGQVTFFSGDK